MSRLLTIPTVTDWIRPHRIVLRRGARAGIVADYQLICGAGPYELDVLVRELQAPRGIELAGQVTAGNSLYDPVGELPLSLVDAAMLRVVSETETDRFGEFDLDSRRAGQFGLRLGEDPDAPVVLVWEEER